MAPLKTLLALLFASTYLQLIAKGLTVRKTGRTSQTMAGLRENLFTRAELTFLLSTETSWLFSVESTRGLENFKPTRWYPSAWVTRTHLARMLREAFGSFAVAAKGALGIL